ncbi:MAG TPA: bifunctional cobalt-precorrin-7 (C(5))-methyltransferase/cobalt-precorrin-6B (C(15))-methyltransferase [Lachnospiraceae bacterium]|nr:bifunctional cobalt-precorrin-7 (C(5))-methyltransferase/cobalt-precorrin-6B (C(15))-methyltransferase [Lachnospiraceae bacterium]
MPKIVVFAGTAEGRQIAEFLDRHGIGARVCVATEYGESLLPAGGRLTVSHERLDEMQMETLFADGCDFVVDATHPYAAAVTENIRRACEKTRTEYIRLLRESEGWEDSEVITVDSVAAAAEALCGTKGNILATTGSKELKAYTVIPDYEQRVFARVLSLPDVVRSCGELGFVGQHLICMQGPFSRELNVAMMRQYDIRYLVTKESGKNGGFPEKLSAAREAGAKLVVVGRPLREEGYTLSRCKRLLLERLAITPRQKISLVGIGPGGEGTMTGDAERTIREAELLIGAQRMTDATAVPGQEVFHAYRPDEIKACIDGHPECEKVAVALSGDVGFFSGAKKLLEVLGPEVEILPGISSMVCFCAKLGIPWEDVRPYSVHGKEENLVGRIKCHPKVFAILGTADGVAGLCEKLHKYGMDEVHLTVGERLTYPYEKITQGYPRDFLDLKTDPLCVVYLENPAAAGRVVTHGMSDDRFLRDKAPMTKEEVRTVSVAKLQLRADSVVYDVGAGTGSVSVEIALAVPGGQVYAVEKKPAAVELLRRNKIHFGVDNLTVIEGPAPEALEDLPVPTHAFIGGSSGNLREIVALLLKKNPAIRIVVNAITLETVEETLRVMREFPVTDTEVVSLSVARSREAGAYHMMMGQNPVYIFTFSGEAQP